MKKYYDFGRIISLNNEDDFDPFAIPYERAERAIGSFDLCDFDLNTLTLAAAAYICLSNSAECGNDFSLFSQLGFIVHPDFGNAAVHSAKLFVDDIPFGKTCIPDSGCFTVYREIEVALRTVFVAFFGSEKKVEQRLNSQKEYEDIQYGIEGFIDAVGESAYHNDPFFAFAVCVYAMKRDSLSRKEAVSYVYNHLPYTDFAPKNCYDEIRDAILLVDSILDVRFFSITRPYIIIWYVFGALAEYYEKLYEEGLEHDNCDCNWSGFDELDELINDETTDDDDPVFDDVFDFSDEDDEETDEDDAGFDEVFDFSGNDEEEEDALAFEDVFELRDEEETA